MLKHIKTLPRFDEWGIVPEGHTGPRENPRPVEQVEAAKSARSSTSDSDEGNASRGAGPSAGFTSASRCAPPKADLQGISSSSGEDPARVAPFRGTVEDEESDGEEGRCDHAPRPSTTGRLGLRRAILARRQPSLERERKQAPHNHTR